MRVVLADDSLLLREGVARLLEEAGLEVVAQAGDGEDLLRKVGAHKPDVAIVDVRMPPTHTDEGLRAAAEIRDKHPDTGVLVLSQYIEEAYAMELLSSNAEGVGYLLKDRVADLERFIDAVRRVGEGGSALDPEVVSRLLGRRRQEDPLAEISPRERQVLALMAEGRSNHAIATELVVTERAVEKHVTSIFTKLNLPPDGRRPPPRAGGADLPQGLIAAAPPRMRGATGAARAWARNEKRSRSSISKPAARIAASVSRLVWQPPFTRGQTVASSARCSRARRGERAATCSKKRSSPPGRITRASSRSAAAGSATLHSTAVTTPASIDASSAGSASATPSTTRTGTGAAARGLLRHRAQMRLGLDRDAAR